MNDNLTHKSFINCDNKEINQYIVEHSLRLSPAQHFIIEKTQSLPMSVMLMSPVEMQLLANICLVMNATKTLDIGVFTGYSALSIAEVLPSHGRVVALDVVDQYLNDYCIPAWKMAGVESKIDFRKNPAIKSLQELIDAGESESFDFALIDADKENYLNYYELCFQLIRPKGIIAVDNVIWDGKILDQADQSSATVGIRRLNDHLAQDERVRISFLKIGDGLTIVVKK